MTQPAPDGDRYSDTYAVTDDGPRDADTAATRPRSRWRAVALVAGMAVAAVLAGGLVPGLVLRPLPDPAPEPGLLDRGGFGAVRLGQTFTECRRAGGAGGPCGGSSNSASGDDNEYECTRYEGTAQAGGSVWVWTREGVVAVVGVAGPTGAGGFRTWPGLALGDDVDPPPPELDRFEPGSATPGLSYRLQINGVTTTLADLDGDGRLDSAAVADTAGLVCRAGPPVSAA